jgi:acetoin utilization deacetylase AcuC-like enzyme
MRPVLIVSSERFGGHEPPPGHAERPERAVAMTVVADHWRALGASLIEPEPATVDQLCRVHDRAYVESIASTSGQAVMLDPDTYTSPESYDVARLAAGAAIVATERVLDGSVSRALALVRPPGHHAGSASARGFCLFNNVAVACAHARAMGVQRVAIVDVDVHHGNGTQEIFEGDPRVLYVSLHQFPHYPGTGWAAQVGLGDGVGFTVNVPLDAGATDGDYDVVFRTWVVPMLARFQPGLILVSAGYDAHEQDPLGGMRVTEEGFALMTRHITDVADQCCGGRVVMVTEGGYELPALVSSLDATVRVLADWPDAPPLRPLRGGEKALPAEASGRAETALEQVRAAQGLYWRGL